MRLVKKQAVKLGPEKTGQLMNLIHKAIAKDKKFFRGCETIRKILAGDIQFKSAKAQEGAKIEVNLMHAHTRTLLPTLFFRDPFLEVQPLNESQESSAVVWESVLNQYWERTGYKRETKRVVLDAIVYPEGYKKWIFNSAEDQKELRGDEPIQEGTGVESEENKAGPSDWQTITGPVGVRISPTQVVMDSVERKLDQSRFVSIRYKKLMSELIADDRYPVITTAFRDKKRLQSGSTSAQTMLHRFDDSESPTIIPDDDEIVTIHEVWVYQLVDFNLYKQVVVLLDDYTDEPIRPITSWEAYTGKFQHTYPLVKLELNPVPDEKAVSELGVWKSLQDAINWLTSRLVSMVENQKQFYHFYPSNATHPEEAKRQFYSGKVREFIEATDSGAPVIEPIPLNAAPRDDYNLVQMMQSFIQQVGGIGQNRRGSSGIRTAREAGIIENASQVKDDEKIDSVADFIQEEAEITVRMLRHTLKPGFVFKLTNDVGTAEWAEFTDFDAAWSPDVRVRANSFRARQNQQRVQALLQVFQVGLQLFPIYGQRIALDRIFRSLAEELQIPNVSEILTPQIEARLKQMMELMRLGQGKPTPVLQEDDHTTELAVIADFKATDLFTDLEPNIQDLINQHEQQHNEALQQNQSIAPQASPQGNQFDDLQGGGENQDPGPSSEAQGDQFPIGGAASSNS